MKTSKFIMTKLSLIPLILILLAQLAIARPDFDVHPRDIETRVSRWNEVQRDTLRIDNSRGHDADEVLIWSVEIVYHDEEDNDWLEVSEMEGEVEVDGRDWPIVIQRRENMDTEHVYADLVFHSNDPTREVYTVPVAVHDDVYPRITTSWGDAGEWWGIDMNYIYDEMFWGETYSFALNISNPSNQGWGGAELIVEEIRTNNGYWEITPNAFEVAPGRSQRCEFVFSADEVGQNSATISSVSNAWDPRELDFRILAVVLPVFRLDNPLPNIELDEDEGQVLIADLDTVFTCSDPGLDYEIESPNLVNNVARNGEFHLTPFRNWNGVSEVFVTAINGEETLADTFSVVVHPVNDAPARFDLLSPGDGEEISWASEDTMFTWQESEDIDSEMLEYHLILDAGDNHFESEGLDTASISMSILAEVLDLEQGGEFTWTVNATDGELTTAAWSTFTNTIGPMVYPPSIFDLTSPSDGDTVRWDSEDTLFVWEPSVDPDEDDLTYTLVLNPGMDNEHMVKDITETQIHVQTLENVLDLNAGGEFCWTVKVSDGVFEVDAASINTNYIVPLGLENSEYLPDETGLIGIYPNPFNNQVNIQIGLSVKQELEIKVFDLSGRMISQIFKGTENAGMHVFKWAPDGVPSGQYMMHLNIDGNSQVHPVTYSK